LTPAPHFRTEGASQTAYSNSHGAVLRPSGSSTIACGLLSGLLLSSQRRRGEPQIQALDRTQLSLPLKPGKAGTMTHDYKRHGTTTLFAALILGTSCLAVS